MLGCNDIPFRCCEGGGCALCGGPEPGLVGNCELCGAAIDDVADIGDRLVEDPSLMWCKGECAAQAAREAEEWSLREAFAMGLADIFDEDVA